MRLNRVHLLDLRELPVPDIPYIQFHVHWNLPRNFRASLHWLQALQRNLPFFCMLTCQESQKLGILLNLILVLVPLLSYLRVGKVSTKRVTKYLKRQVEFEEDYVSLRDSRLGYASMIRTEPD